MSPPNLYDVLGVGPDAAPAALRRAYLDLAQRHHPDRPGGDADRMRAVNEAWATLGDPIRRARYDRALAAARTPARPAPAPRSRPAIIDHEDYKRDLRFDGLGFDDDGDDDQPLGPTIVLPRWLAMLPVGLFALSVVLGVVGLLGGLAPVLGLAVVTFVLSAMLFAASPFLALYASRRVATGGRDAEDGG